MPDRRSLIRGRGEALRRTVLAVRIMSCIKYVKKEQIDFNP
jgi:hypothetical protein